MAGQLKGPTAFGRTLDMFALLGLAYGAAHLTSWNYQFPTGIERLLWQVAACLVSGVGFLIVVVYYGGSWANFIPHIG
jgi:hypothetical protein